MASGDVMAVFVPTDAIPPSSNFATLDTRNGRFVLDFDETTAETTYFTSVLDRKYNGGGLTVELRWAATTATSGGVSFTVALERVAVNDLDIDSDSFATGTLGNAATNGTSGKLTQTSIAFLDGTAMDSLAAGEAFRMSVTRTVSDSGDDMTGDAELYVVVVRET